jgi:hypothetical protein
MHESEGNAAGKMLDSWSKRGKAREREREASSSLEGRELARPGRLRHKWLVNPAGIDRRRIGGPAPRSPLTRLPEIVEKRRRIPEEEEVYRSPGAARIMHLPDESPDVAGGMDAHRCLDFHFGIGTQLSILVFVGFEARIAGYWLLVA